MDAAEITQLRQQLELSSWKLAERLGVAHGIVLDWEAGRTFATRRHVDAMRKLQHSAGPREPPLNRDGSAPADPAVCPEALVRVMQHLSAKPRLFAKVLKLVDEEDV